MTNANVPSGASSDIVDALVISLLAVNNYQLDKAWALLPSLKSNGLTDPAQVAGADVGDLTVRLASAGYDRGMLTGLFAERLRQLMISVLSEAFGGLRDAIQANDQKKFSDLFCAFPGVGPRVCSNAWLLLK